MAPKVHLVKLCVGAEAVEDIVEWQQRVAADNRAAGRAARPTHVTRMWPKRAEELLDGGSLYWVVKGLVLARQRILAFDRREGGDGISRCAIGLDPQVVRTVPQPRRPFQGWRYLDPNDAPRDLMEPKHEEMPTELMARLAELGVL